jgi:glycosyltransferase involved in cell wall biosynthesis
MKICIIGAKTFPPKIGGIEVHIYEIATRLAERGHEVSTIVGQKNNKKYEEINSVKVYRVPFLEHYLTTMPTMVPLIITKAKKLDADIYHAHSGIVGFASTLFLNPTVFTIHGLSYNRSDWPLPVRWTIRYWEITAIRSASKTISVDYLTHDSVKKFRDDDCLIPNGFSFERYDEKTAPPLEYTNTRIKILFVGRLVPSKGVELLIEAFNGLPEAIKNHCILYIIGDGPQKDKIIALASKEERIRVIGYVEDAIPYFQHSDIFVLPSLYEGLPIALLEAAALNNACIATHIGDIPKRFTHDRELLLVEPGNVIDLRNKLINLVTDEKKRRFLSKNAMELIKEKYDWEKITNQIESVYQSVLN